MARGRDEAVMKEEGFHGEGAPADECRCGGRGCRRMWSVTADEFVSGAVRGVGRVRNRAHDLVFICDFGRKLNHPRGWQLKWRVPARACHSNYQAYYMNSLKCFGPKIRVAGNIRIYH